MTPIERGEQDIYNRVISVLGLREAVALQPGHTGAHLLRTQGAEPRVVKIGISPTARAEIQANRLGYQHIEAAGGTSLLPGQLQYTEGSGYVVLGMRYLGEPLTTQFKESSTLPASFVNALERSFLSTIRPDVHNEQTRGLAHLAETINGWLARIVSETKRVGRTLPCAAPLLDPKAFGHFRTTHSSLMLFDFTPDNVFFDGNRVSFIDPWAQDTYRGSCIPSLAQFATLCEIYQLPQASLVHQELRRMAARLGDRMNVPTEAIDVQWKLGTALQKTLSCFVRIENRWPLAQDFFLDVTQIGKAISR